MNLDEARGDDQGIDTLGIGDRRGGGWGVLLLAHHHPAEYHRCILIGGRPVCARCLGFYPVLLLLLGVQLGGAPLTSLLDVAILYLLPLPALVDHALGSFGVRGSNLVRTVSGALLGVALGRGLYIYFREPTSPRFWAQLALLGIPLAAVFAIRLVCLCRLRRTKREPPAPTREPPAATRHPPAASG